MNSRTQTSISHELLCAWKSFDVANRRKDRDRGQQSNTGDFGLMFYNARWLDVSLGRFAQADSIVPPGVQGLDHRGTHLLMSQEALNGSDAATPFSN